MLALQPSVFEMAKSHKNGIPSCSVWCHGTSSVDLRKWQRKGLGWEDMSKMHPLLRGLAALEAGWDGEHAVAIDRSTLDVAQVVLQMLSECGGMLPACAPVPDGRIDLEWPELCIRCTVDGDDTLVHITDALSYTLPHRTADQRQAFAVTIAEVVRSRTVDRSQ